MIAVVINGESRELPVGLNVLEMLGHLGIAANRVAIERNRDILPRAQWDQTSVEANDSYEIVQFVGGG
jgi:thiamine biosynthesis protein ThiS